jgi:type I protein arginine methyltransferase
MYSVLNYGDMVLDRVRMDVYARAIERVVKPGSIVLDLGAGTGVFSILAARAGASRVHAVEPNPAIHLLPDLAKENGVSDRIEIHPISSFDLELGEKADVIVSDLRGSFPLSEDHTAILQDARTRLLVPNGVMIPVKDRLFVAAVDSTNIMYRLDQGISGYERLGVKTGAIRSSLVDSVHLDVGCALRASDVVTKPAAWSVVDYATFEGGVVEGQVELVPQRTGVVCALAVWFEATIYEELGFTNAPGFDLAYARVFLPLRERVSLGIDDRMTVAVRVDPRGRRWAWDSTVVDKSGSKKAVFRQSSFFGTPTSAAELLRESEAHRPTLSSRGKRAASILAAMDGERTVGEIVEQLVSLDGDDRKPPKPRLLEEVRDAVSRYAK